MEVKFISYTGKYSCLCSGELTIEIGGVRYTLPSYNTLISGGKVGFDESWEEHIEEGPWEIGSLPKELEQYREAIAQVVNDNIEWGMLRRLHLKLYKKSLTNKPFYDIIKPSKRK